MALGVLLGLSEALGCTEQIKSNGLVDSIKSLVTSQCLRRKEPDDDGTREVRW